MTAGKPIKRISADQVSVSDYWREVWLYRHFIWVLALQEVKAQYVQTRLNVLWIVLRPLMVLALFTFIFGRLITVPGIHYPYALFAFSGLLVWNNFSHLVNNAGHVVQNHQNLIKKVYFPRIILILSRLLFSLIELGISIILLIILMVILQQPVSCRILLLPAFIAISVLAGLTIAVWLSAFSIRYRDLHQFVPTLVGFLIWLTPVFYPVSLVPRDYAFLIYLNPVSAAIQGSRWAVLGDTAPDICYLPAILLTVLLLVVGTLIFIRSDRDLPDYI